MNIKNGDIIQYIGGEEVQLPCRRNDSMDFRERVWIDNNCPLFVMDVTDDTILALGFGHEEFMITYDLFKDFAKFYLVRSNPVGFELNTYYRTRGDLTVIRLDGTYARVGERHLVADDIVYVVDSFEDSDSVVAATMGGSDVELNSAWRDCFEEVAFEPVQ